MFSMMLFKIKKSLLNATFLVLKQYNQYQRRLNHMVHPLNPIIPPIGLITGMALYYTFIFK